MYVHENMYVHIHVMRRFLYVYIHSCIYIIDVCIYTFMYVYYYVHIHETRRECMYTCTRKYSCTYMYVHTCMFSCTHIHIERISMYVHENIHVRIYMWKYACENIRARWRRLIGSPKLQIIFHKRATRYRSLLRKMTYINKGSYESSPPCMRIYMWE